MEIQGKIIATLPEASGTSKSGKAWKKRDYVLETQEKYPKKVCFQLFNDKVDQYPMQIGQEVKVGIDIESREYNGRWYTQVSAYKVEVVGGMTQSISQPQPQLNTTPPQSDDLPF